MLLSETVCSFDATFANVGFDIATNKWRKGQIIFANLKKKVVEKRNRTSTACHLRIGRVRKGKNVSAERRKSRPQHLRLPASFQRKINGIPEKVNDALAGVHRWSVPKGVCYTPKHGDAFDIRNPRNLCTITFVQQPSEGDGPAQAGLDRDFGPDLLVSEGLRPVQLGPGRPKEPKRYHMSRFCVIKRTLY